jgi:quercetin dioxygenase-like cupin family protein
MTPFETPTSSSPVAKAATAAPGAATAPRVDLYGPIHKALRSMMADTLLRVGRLDTDDAQELAATLTRAVELFEACRQHVAKENKYVHSAIEARQPGASERIAGEHVGHLDAIAALEADVAALQALPTAGAAARLYSRLARFVAENFEHMHIEETQHNAVLWASYSDAELLQIDQRILAAIEPAEMTQVLRWMVPAMNPAERAAMLGGMQQQLPPEAMRDVLDLVRPQLDDTGWAKLARALNIPGANATAAQPFVVEARRYPRPLDVLGTRITVLAANADTRSHEVTLQEGPPDSGPPPHSHPWHETFFVLRGQVHFDCAGQPVLASAGTLVHVPAGTVHAFRFASEDASMLEIAGAGGHATAMFADLAREVPAGPPDVPKVIGLLQRHGVAVADAVQ